jgi:tryptophan 7-halogenase
MIHDVIVLGGGSAGFLAALTLKKKLPDLSVTVVRSADVGVIGVGESTTLAVPNHLHGYLDIDQTEFHQQAQPAWKLGARLLWGPRPFFDYTFSLQMDTRNARLTKGNGYYCEEDLTYVDLPSSLMSHKKVFVRQPDGTPLFRRYFGYHIDNQRFVSFLEAKAAQMGITCMEDVLTGVDKDDQGIRVLHLASGAAVSADLYVDCSGFRSLLLGEALAVPYTSFQSTLYCDRAVVSSWKRTVETINPYTTIETMTNGWCWQIDHPDSIMRGYVYGSAFQSDEDAEQEFRKKNPKVDWTRLINFKSGRYHRSWEKNVVAIGNAAGFVEPLQSTSLAIICDESRLVAECLYESDRQPTPSLVDAYNRMNVRAWDCIRDFLGLHYRFNTRYDTPFWQACRADVELGPIQELLDYYQENGPSTFGRTSLIHGNDFWGMEGYYVVLVGQKVPHRRPYAPTLFERRVWQGIRAENRVKALTALTIRQALDAITAPNWKWTPGFFGKSAQIAAPEAKFTSWISGF